MPLTDEQIEARREMWTYGIIAPWYLRDSQLEVYELLLREKFPFVQAARRFGKTTSILCFVIEQLIQNPGWIARWCFPFKNTAREVLTSEMAKLQAHCPDSIKFQYQTTDSVFINPLGSKLYIRGVNEDRGESARGAAANILVADEYGFWNEPKYIIQSVLYPQLEKQEGQWLIKTSTPPPDLGHLYYTEREIASRKNRFISKTIYDNEALSQDELNEIIEESGGIDSIAFKRERLCEDVGDPELLVVKEFSDLNIVEDDYPRPQFPTFYMGGDSGTDDNTALLFAWFDFAKNEVVVEDEYVENGKTSKQIVDFAKAKELELWGEGVKPRSRVYDANKQILWDICNDLNYMVELPDKNDKIASINQFRIEVGGLRFKVKRRCKHLIRQLKVGMWKDVKHTDFDRNEELGHLDAIAAAVYLNRSIDRKHNPIPHNLGLSKFTHQFPSSSPLGQTEQALKDVFGGKSRRFR